MRISTSVSEKCATPPNMNHKNTKIKPMRLNIGIMAAVFGAAFSGSLFTAVINAPRGIIGIGQMPACAGVDAAKIVRTPAPVPPTPAAARSDFADHRRASRRPARALLLRRIHDDRAGTSRHTVDRIDRRDRGRFAAPSPLRTSAALHAGMLALSSGIATARSICTSARAACGGLSNGLCRHRSICNCLQIRKQARTSASRICSAAGMSSGRMSARSAIGAAFGRRLRVPAPRATPSVRGPLQWRARASW